jgi:uncharacterized protein
MILVRAAGRVKSWNAEFTSSRPDEENSFRKLATMEVVLGFLIAVVIAITGVGAGTITAPLLLLFLHVPVSVCVGTALAYATLVKLIVVPVQMWRRQVNYKIVGMMVLGGIPGVVLGSILFRRALHGGQASLYAALGLIIVISSVLHVYRYFRPYGDRSTTKNRPGWIAGFMLPIGAEVGFSSSGAGALGTVLLLSLTSLSASQVVGTDLAAGFLLSLVGSGVHILNGSYDALLLGKLVAGGTLGAIVGSSLAPRLPNRQLRLALSLWLLVIGIQFCYQAAHSTLTEPHVGVASHLPATATKRR